MKTWMETRIVNTDWATVYVFVSCADETLVSNVLFEGTEHQCIEYANYYKSNGMQVDTIYYESQTK